MNIDSPGRRYALQNKGDQTKTQTLTFAFKDVSRLEGEKKLIVPGAPQQPTEVPKLFLVEDGTTPEEVLRAVIDYLACHGSRLPCNETLLAGHHCQIALGILNNRTEDRTARGVEGTPQI
jgi:hypothetical protein